MTLSAWTCAGPLCLLAIGACRSSQSLRGTYIATAGSRLHTMELHDSNRGILRPATSLTYALRGDTLLVQADPAGGEPPSPTSRFLIRRDTLRELTTSTEPLVFVRQH